MAKASEWGQAPRHLDFVRRSSMFATNSSSANTANSCSTGATTISNTVSGATGIGAASSNDDSSRFYSSAFAHPTGESQSSGATSTSTATLSSNLSANAMSSNVIQNVPQRAKGVLPPTPLTHSYRVTGGVSPGIRGSPLPQQPLGGDNGNSNGNSSVQQQQQQQQQQYDTHEAARKQVLDAMRIVRLYPAPLTCSAAYQVKQTICICVAVCVHAC
jgi:hypothetical protein